jgi:hypothetical protein
VDKEEKESPLGEEARFRNAKLSYYKGDFDWAQEQLKVLKASTSELISNDAIEPVSLHHRQPGHGHQLSRDEHVCRSGVASISE